MSIWEYVRVKQGWSKPWRYTNYTLRPRELNFEHFLLTYVLSPDRLLWINMKLLYFLFFFRTVFLALSYTERSFIRTRGRRLSTFWKLTVKSVERYNGIYLNPLLSELELLRLFAIFTTWPKFVVPKKARVAPCFRVDPSRLHKWRTTDHLFVHHGRLRHVP